jgi:hypothetical protein
MHAIELLPSQRAANHRHTKKWKGWATHSNNTTTASTRPRRTPTS